MRRGTRVAMVVVALWGLAALAAPGLEAEANRIALERILAPPSWHVPMGRDDLGRPLLARVLVGARLSLGVTLVVVALAAAVGTLIGVLAAGWVLMRVALRLKRRARRLGDRGLGRGFDRAAVALLVVSYPSARLYARLSDDVVDWENWTRFGELGVETRRRS